MRGRVRRRRTVVPWPRPRDGGSLAFRVLLQCLHMADWRQIQARIRKAKNSPDAPAKLHELFQRTRDAMVAWELALIEEKAGHNDEAGKWYTIAAQRFRRAEWKKKAEEALVRLGIPLPAAASAEMPAEPGAEPHPAPATLFDRAHPTLALGEIPEGHDEAAPAEASVGAGGPPAGLRESAAEGLKRRRRGRRGGRGRRRKGAPAASSLPTRAYAAPAEPRPPRPPMMRPAPFEPSPFEGGHEPPRAAPAEFSAPQLPSERAAHGRAGDPALASRMAHLESMLRRLVAGPLHRLDEADEAPAGPGVFLLSDSDLISSYYIEACQTLRVGVGNLARGGGRSGKGGRGGRSQSEIGLKANLAKHLGISEAKVSQYLKDHCVVRWIQLDDEAPHLAHFAIGVLRTPLNVD